MAKPKICILHDFFLYRGGAERFDVMAAKAAGADLAAAYFDEGSFDLAAMGFSGRKIAFSRRLFPESGAFPSGIRWVFERLFSRVLPGKIRRILRYLHFTLAVRSRTAFLGKYDTVVFSGDTLGAVRNCQKSALKICYFHSIPRYLFDQKALYLAKVPFWLRPAYRVARYFSIRAFFRDLSQIDRIYVNGKNLQSYCLKHLGRESEILYPPVDTAEFRPCDLKEKGDYYLSFSKLATFKRVDAAVRAFREMPDKKFLVVYGINDPQKDEVLALAALSPNIECRILADNAELPKIVARAIATVFVSKNEDFWMVAIESMAAGTPVIAADSGGLRETVVADATGIFVAEDFSVEDLKRAVSEMTPERAFSMRAACLERAEEFSKERFEKEVWKAFG
jgi:glycosyltransferase involved in cell wall biosynthesis